MAVETLTRGAIPAPDTDVVPRRATPVKAWACVGLGLWAFEVFVLAKWVTGPYFRAVPAGPTQPSGSMKTAIVVYLVVEWIAFFAAAYYFVVRPWRRDGRLAWDGALFIGWAVFYWLYDPLANAFALFDTYNAWIPNMGSWVNSIPGWVGVGQPGAQLPEPWLFTAAAYPLFFVPTTLFVCWLMRRTRAYRPRMGTFGLIMVAWLVMILVDFVVEAIWTHIGLYTYAGGIHAFTVFPGHFYRMPIYNSVCWGAAMTAVGYLRWSRNDRGESVAERGAGELSMSESSRALVRLFATSGWFFTAILVVFFVPIWFFSLQGGGPVPRDISQRSYFMDGLCGPHTAVACPAPNVPLWTRHSVTITPDGRVHVPAGTRAIHQPTTFAGGH
jgi:hypothetical protein